MSKIMWVVVHANSVKEARFLGQEVLKTRLAACFDIYPNRESLYFWPPMKNTLETTKGATLILETLPKNVKKITAVVLRLHSDKIPFVGQIEIKSLNPKFTSWLSKETK